VEPYADLAKVSVELSPERVQIHVHVGKLTWFNLRRVQICNRWILYDGEDGIGTSGPSWLRDATLISSGTVSYQSRISRSRASKSARLSSRMRAGSK